MKIFISLTIFLFSSTLLADSLKRDPKSLQERIRSEFGLDQNEITCEFILSGAGTKPRHSVLYDKISKKACLSKAKRALILSPYKFEKVLVKHDEIENELVLSRRVKNEK